MKTIKQYINNNKQILIIFIGALSFLFIHNEVYCHPMVFMVLGPAVNYFSTISPEFYVGKIIDKLFEYSPWIISKTFEYTPYTIYGTGGIVLGTIGLAGGIKVAEYGYNWRYFANQYAHNTPVVGSLLKGANTTYKWFTKKDLTNIEYNYFYPKIASALGYPDLFNKKLEVDLSTFNSNLTSREPNIEYRDRTIFADTPISVYEFKDKPVYVPVVEYKDRENLQTLDNSVQALNVSAQNLKFSQNNQKTREDLLAEINLLREHESAVCLTLQDLSRNYETFKLAGVTDEQGFSLAPIKLKYLFFPKEESKLIKIYFDDLNYVALNKQSFSVKYPQIYLTLNTLTQARHEYTGYRFSNDQIFEQYDSYVYFRYNETRTYFSYNFELDAPNCLIIEKSLQEKKTESYLLSKIEEIQSRSLETAQSNLDLLVSGLSEKIANEHRLINVETRDQGTQTANFDLNETVYDRISSFLEIRDETAFVVASHEGRNLPFNNMQIKSYSKPEKVVTIQTQETSVETQTEPSISENVEILGMNSVNSSVFQNMGAMFSAALVWSIAHDFQTLELVARSLLGFIHIPEYNQAFIAATQMSVVDLQMEYGFNLDDARKAYDSIEYANTMRTTGSLPSDLNSQLSDSNNYTENAPKATGFGWKDYLLVSTILFSLGCVIYINWQTIKTGTYINGNEIQAISPNIEAWKGALFDKINKL